MKKAIPLTQPFPKGKVCVYRGRDGALRRRRRVQRRNERTIDFTPSIPRLNGAGTAQRAVPTTRCFGCAKQVPRFGRRLGERDCFSQLRGLGLLVLAIG